MRTLKIFIVNGHLLFLSSQDPLFLLLVTEPHFSLGKLAKERKANPSTLIGLEPPLASWFQALASPHAHFLHHSDWFREGLVAQGDPVRLRSVPFATIIGKETLFLPAVTNLWM